MVNVSTATASFFWNETGDVIVEQRIPVVGGDYEALDCQFLQALWRMELCEAVYNLEVSRGGDGLDGIARGGGRLFRASGRWPTACRTLMALAALSAFPGRRQASRASPKRLASPMTTTSRTWKRP